MTGIRDIIDRCREKALRCEDLTRDEFVALLSIDPDSPDCDYLGETARSVKEHYSGNVTRLGTSIGLDLRPCRMSCDFCSLGEKVGLITQEYEISDDTAVQLITDLRKRGFYQFTLSRLMNFDIESEGVSPAQIFGLDRDAMEKLLTGLSVQYPDFINATFTLDLDNINLRDDKTSADVLELF